MFASFFRPSMRAGTRHLVAAIAALAMVVAASASSAATLGPGLSSWLAGAAPTAIYPQAVIVTYNEQPLRPLTLLHLQLLGIDAGVTLPNLGMVAMTATAAQIRALQRDPDVRSVWPNARLHYLDYHARILGGVDQLRNDPSLTTLHGGLPVTGQGVTVAVDDSGCDAAHDDLAGAIIGNWFVAADSTTLPGLLPLTVVPGGPNDDTVGHGSHVAGIIAGSGADSAGLYQGVAPGAHLICLGSGAGLFVLNALGGLEWTIENQALYNIRVETNSWGTTGAYSADDPINVASKLMTDKGIVVLFAAGNAGPAQATMNPYAQAPWVIGVGAGTLEGTLASFSSAGVANGAASGVQNGPSIVAPGTGYAFAADASRFPSDIISVRDPIGSDALLDAPQDVNDIDTANLPYYTEMSGTSMATPYAAGVVALMVSADPTLTPAEVQAILRQTATRMPGYADWQVGSGYINAWAAVDAVYHRGKDYGGFVTPSFNQKVDRHVAASTAFNIDYEPVPGYDTSTTFDVQAGVQLLDILGTVNDISGEVGGNTLALVATGPDGSTYSTPIALPVIGSANVEVRVPNPAAGTWTLRATGVCGLAAVPQACLPSPGAALPGSVSGSITQWQYALDPVPADIVGNADQDAIEYALFNRLMDSEADGGFHPGDSLTRLDFARLLALDTPLRQRIGDDAAPFLDVAAADTALVEAVTGAGDALRDWNFSQGPLMTTLAPGQFAPDSNMTRLELAIGLVRALGKQAAADALAGTTVTASYNGESVPLADNDQIPAAGRGYVQLALDAGILNAQFALTQGADDFEPTITATVQPNAKVTRGFAAKALANFNQHFATGL
ncbi:MAG TPA: S8 family serine peptidase [Rhodanobacteraceae bacterium]|nr:S8 family serine peptidase [Rhodanobacteraceae bacterium]